MPIIPLSDVIVPQKTNPIDCASWISFVMCGYVVRLNAGTMMAQAAPPFGNSPLAFLSAFMVFHVRDLFKTLQGFS